MRRLKFVSDGHFTDKASAFEMLLMNPFIWIFSFLLWSAITHFPNIRLFNSANGKWNAKATSGEPANCGEDISQ